MNVGEILLYSRRILAQVRADLQVLRDGEIAEDLAGGLRAMVDADGDDPLRPLGRQVGLFVGLEKDFPLARAQQSGDGGQRRRLARAVGADQGDNLAVPHGEGDAAHGMGAPLG